MLLSPNAMGRPLRTGLYLTTGVIAAFLLLPVVFIVLLSFGSSQWLVFPPPGWTFKWYGQFFSNPEWMDAALASLKVAVLTTVAAVLLGLPTAFALVRGRFPGREMLYGLFTMPMIVPLVIIAVAVYALFLKLGYTGTLFAFVVSHVIVALPFTIISIINSLKLFDQSIEDAAVICGASPWNNFFKVFLPLCRSGLFSGALMVFVMSLGYYVTPALLGGAQNMMLPEFIVQQVQSFLNWGLASAAAALLVLITLVLFYLYLKLQPESPVGNAR